MSTPQGQLRRLIITRQIVYLLVAICVTAPFLIPALSVPFEPTDVAKTFFKEVDSLEPGSHVMIAFDYDPASKAELYPMSVALLRHCFAKGLIPVVMTHWPNGVGMCEKACEETAREFAAKGDPKIAGTDYVLLGYKPGLNDLVLNMGVDLKGAYPKDRENNPTAGMAALEGVRTLKDMDLVIDLAAGNTVEMWIRYGSDRFGFKLAAGTTAVSAPRLYTYLNANQLAGLLGGARGCADYEKLIEQPAKATSGMVAQSVTQLLLIVLILGANVWYVVRRVRGTART